MPPLTVCVALTLVLVAAAITSAATAAPSGSIVASTRTLQSRTDGPSELSRPTQLSADGSIAVLDQLQYHMVAFRFTNTTTPADVQRISLAYRALRVKCSYMVDLFGSNSPNSAEGFQQGMQQSWITVFRNEADRDYFVGRPITYPFDPHHDAFKAMVGPYLQKEPTLGLIVIDFINQPFVSSPVGPPGTIPSAASQLPPLPLPAPWRPAKSVNDSSVYHFIAMRFANGTDPAAIANVAALYRALLTNCPYILSMEGGLPNSKEGQQRQMDTAWLLRFRSVADRDYFVGTDPAHADPYPAAVRAYSHPLIHQPSTDGLIIIDWVNEQCEPATEAYVSTEWAWADFVWDAPGGPGVSAGEAYYRTRGYEHALISGVKVWTDPRTNYSTTFVSIPRLKNDTTPGQFVPATLAFVDRFALQTANTSLAPAGPSGGVALGQAPLLNPYPSWAMQALGDASCIQSVLGFEIDSVHNHLYILDQGRVGNKPALASSIKLIIWDLLSNSEVQRWVCPAAICPPQTSFLNDIVIDTINRFAFITDTGPPTDGVLSQFDPSLLVYSFESNTAWRVLERHNSTMPDFSFRFQINGSDIYPGAPMMAGADGIALTPDANWLFFNPLSSRAIYRIPTCVLRASNPDSGAGPTIDQATLESSVAFVMQKPGNADGLAFSSTLNGTRSVPAATDVPSAISSVCSVDDLSVDIGYQLIATSLGQSAVYSITGDLAHVGPAAADVPASSLSISIIHSASDGSMDWPDAVGFDHAGVVLFTTNRGQLFNGLAPGMDFTQINFRIWGRYIDTDSYQAIVQSNAPNSDDDTKGFWTILHVILVLLGAVVVIVLAAVAVHKCGGSGSRHGSKSRASSSTHGGSRSASRRADGRVRLLDDADEIHTRSFNLEA